MMLVSLELLADLGQVVPVIGGIALLVTIIAVGFACFRGYERLARRSLERKYSDLQPRAQPNEGDVVLSYHTYHGLLVWFTQTPHQVILPPNDARQLLGRLLRFNLTWGLVT